jgi:plasmid stabilization system protein ParE
MNAPEVATRFREAVRFTAQFLCEHPLVGSYYRSKNRHLQDLRSWPVAQFDVLRIYYRVNADAIRIIRILHGKRDIKRILERERDV